MEPKRRDLAFAVAAVAGAVLALLAPALIRGEGLLPVGSLWRVPPWSAVLPPTAGNGLLLDQLLDFWPWRLFLQSELVSGRFPFWNPFLTAGVPFAGCVQAAPFHPLNVLLLILPPAGWSVAAAFVKLTAAGVFTTLHARRLGAGRTGAALAGVAFALCGFMVAWLGHPQTNVACALPLLFWGLGLGFDAGGARAWIPAALALALVLLGGHPPTMLHVLAAALAYAAFRVLRLPAVERRARLPWAAAAAAAGVALAAPALLPYLEYLSLSSTGAAAAALARWSTRLAPGALLHLLMPLGSGSPTRGAEVLAAAFGLGPESNFLERAGWLSLPVLAFAALGAWRRRDAEARFHLALALFGLASAFGVPPLPWLWRILPGFSEANPTRLLLFFCFGAAVLAALGVDELKEEADAPARSRFATAFTSVLALAACAYPVALSRIWTQLTPAEQGFAAAQLVAFVVEAAAAVWLLRRPALRRWTPLIAALFLLRAGIGVNPTAPSSLLYPATPGIEALSAAQGQGRVMGLGWALAPDTGMTFGLRDARGRDFTTLRRYEELVTGKAGNFDFFETAETPPPSPALFALSAVAATEKSAGGVPASWTKVSASDLLVYRAPQPGRRALFVPAARYATSARALAALHVPGFDPSKEILLDDWEAPASSSAAKGAADIVSDGNDEVVVKVKSDGLGWLLLLDNWYPGWRATVNGVPAAVRRADYSFRAVAVPGGEATVRFTYVPFSFWIGVFCAALSAVFLAYCWKRG